MSARVFFILVCAVNMIIGTEYRGWTLEESKIAELEEAILNDAKTCASCTIDIQYITTDITEGECATLEASLNTWKTCLGGVSCDLKEEKIKTVEAHFQQNCKDCIQESIKCSAVAECSAITTGIVTCSTDPAAATPNPLTLNKCKENCLDSQNQYIDFTGVPGLATYGCQCTGFCADVYAGMVNNDCQGCSYFFEYQLKTLETDVDGSSCATRSQTLAEYTPRAMLYCGYRLAVEGLPTYDEVYDKAAVCGFEASSTVETTVVETTVVTDPPNEPTTTAATNQEDGVSSLESLYCLFFLLIALCY